MHRDTFSFTVQPIVLEYIYFYLFTGKYSDAGYRHLHDVQACQGHCCMENEAEVQARKRQVRNAKNLNKS